MKAGALVACEKCGKLAKLEPASLGLLGYTCGACGATRLLVGGKSILAQSSEKAAPRRQESREAAPTTSEPLDALVAARNAENEAPRANKFGNREVETEDGKFDSEAELFRFGMLKLEEKLGSIQKLERQKVFELKFRGHDLEYHTVGKYRADFVYIRDGKVVVEDVKGYPNDRFPMIKRLVRAIYGIEISVVDKHGNPARSTAPKRKKEL